MRGCVREFTKHASPTGVDKSLQILLEAELITERLETTPGGSARGATMRRETYYDPTPMVFAEICSRVIW